MCTWDNYVHIYALYELTAINNVTRSTWYTYISHWHMSLKKYACHIAYPCATALLKSSYRPCKFYLPSCCHIYVHSKNAPQMPHIQITLCTDMRQLCQYISLIQTYSNQQCDHEHCAQIMTIDTHHNNTGWFQKLSWPSTKSAQKL